MFRAVIPLNDAAIIYQLSQTFQARLGLKSVRPADNTYRAQALFYI